MKPGRAPALLLILLANGVAAQPPGTSDAESEISRILAEGDQALQTGEYKKAINAFESVLERTDGQSWPALVGLATAQLRRERYESCLKSARQALNLSDTAFEKAVAENLVGSALLGTAFSGVKGAAAQEARLRGAEASFRRALALEPDRLNTAWLNLAITLEHLGHLEEALRAQEEYTAREPEDPAAHSRLCWLQYRSSIETGAGIAESRERADLPRMDELIRAYENGITAPVRVESRSPRYTERARKQGVEGMVQLEMVITERGFVTHPMVLEGLSFGMTDQTVRAVCGWRFEPAKQDGKPIAVIFNLSTNFSLQLERP